MKAFFFIEGYKAKKKMDYEETLAFKDGQAYLSEEKATSKAREYFKNEEELSLIIIYKGLKLGEKTGIKYLHRNQDGELDELVSWWSYN